jgi:hypothetical protein
LRVKQSQEKGHMLNILGMLNPEAEDAMILGKVRN